MLDGAMLVWFTLLGVDGESAMDMSHAGHDRSKTTPDMAGMHHDRSKMDPGMTGMDHGEHGLGSISPVSQVVWVVLTLAMVVATTYLAHLFTPITI